MTSEASRVLARPVELTLSTGRTINIAMTLYTLAVLDDELEGGLEALEFKPGQSTLSQLKVIGKVIAASQADEHPLTEEEILKAIDLRDVDEVIEAFHKLTSQLPDPKTNGASDPKAQTDSPGQGSITSEESSLDLQTMSSGN